MTFFFRSFMSPANQNSDHSYKILPPWGLYNLPGLILQRVLALCEFHYCEFHYYDFSNLKEKALGYIVLCLKVVNQTQIFLNLKSCQAVAEAMAGKVVNV